MLTVALLLLRLAPSRRISHVPVSTPTAGAAAATGAIELTWPMAAVAVAYIVGQTVVDTWGE